MSLFGSGRNESADALLGRILVVKPAPEHAVMYRTPGDWKAAQACWQPVADGFALLVQINQLAGMVVTERWEGFGLTG